MYKSAFLRHLQIEGVKYEEVNDHVVRIRYSADNMKDISVVVIFDEDGDNLVSFKSYSLGHVSEGKTASTLIACNTCNRDYRWVKFFIDDDEDVTCQADAVVDLNSVGEECLELVQRMVNIMDDVYPTFMRAFWA